MAHLGLSIFCVSLLLLSTPQNGTNALSDRDPYVDICKSFKCAEPAECPDDSSIFSDDFEEVPSSSLYNNNRDERGMGISEIDPQKLCCGANTCTCNECPEKPHCKMGQVLLELSPGDDKKPGSCCPKYVCGKEPTCDRGIEIIFWLDSCTKCNSCQRPCLYMCNRSDWAPPSNCLTFNNQSKSNGESWTQGDGCEDCICKDGYNKCQTTACIKPQCENAVKLPGTCCPICPDTEAATIWNLPGNNISDKTSASTTTATTSTQIKNTTATSAAATSTTPTSTAATTTAATSTTPTTTAAKPTEKTAAATTTTASTPATKTTATTAAATTTTATTTKATTATTTAASSVTTEGAIPQSSSTSAQISVESNKNFVEPIPEEQIETVGDEIFDSNEQKTVAERPLEDPLIVPISSASTTISSSSSSSSRRTNIEDDAEFEKSTTGSTTFSSPEFNEPNESNEKPEQSELPTEQPKEPKETVASTKYTTLSDVDNSEIDSSSSSSSTNFEDDAEFEKSTTGSTTFSSPELNELGDSNKKPEQSELPTEQPKVPTETAGSTKYNTLSDVDNTEIDSSSSSSNSININIISSISPTSAPMDHPKTVATTAPGAQMPESTSWHRDSTINDADYRFANGNQIDEVYPSNQKVIWLIIGIITIVFLVVLFVGLYFYYKKKTNPIYSSVPSLESNTSEHTNASDLPVGSV